MEGEHVLNHFFRVKKYEFAEKRNNLSISIIFDRKKVLGILLEILDD